MYEIKNLRITNSRSYGMVTVKCNSKWGTNRKSNYLFSTGQGEASHVSRKEKYCHGVSQELAPKQELL